MLTWLETLPLHTFDIREGDKSPLLAAKLRVEADTAAKAAEAAAADSSAAGADSPAAVAEDAGGGGTGVTSSSAAPTDAVRPAESPEAGDAAALRETGGTDAVSTSAEGTGAERNPSEGQGEPAS